MNETNYYAVIPAEVRYDKSLMANAKLLYGEITALCNQKGFCWASNKYFSELYGVSERSIIEWLNSLKNNGYILVNYTYKEGTKSIESRCISLVNVVKKTSSRYEEKFTEPHEEKFVDNNTLSNNTLIKDIVEYLNLKAEKAFRSNTDSTKKYINTRLKEGYTIDDFKKVIDLKVTQWKNDRNMNKFLRPSTLFAPTNFENYLNEMNSVKIEDKYEYPEL